MPPQICDAPLANDQETAIESGLKAIDNADTRRSNSASLLTATSQLFSKTPSSLLQVTSVGSYSRKKLALMISLAGLCVVSIVFSSLYTFHRGFRRTVQFWALTGPWIVQYHLIKFHFFYVLHNQRYNWIVGNSNHPKKNETALALEWQRQSEAYHRNIALKAVTMVAQMGGIYVKIGQALSTMGSGILPEEYVQALRPLQDGIPPRNYATIAAIIEESTGQKMDDMFEWFEEKPVGAATIAQAHRAVLKREQSTNGQVKSKQKTTTRMRSDQKDDMVIVKVQYPEVADLFDADLNNLELLAKIVMPGRSHDQLQNTREWHEREKLLYVLGWLWFFVIAVNIFEMVEKLLTAFVE